MPAIIRGTNGSKKARAESLKKVNREELSLVSIHSVRLQTRLMATPAGSFESKKPFADIGCSSCKSLKLPAGARADKDLCETCRDDLVLQTCQTCQVVCFPHQFRFAPNECDNCFQVTIVSPSRAHFLLHAQDRKDPMHKGVLLLLGPFRAYPSGWLEADTCLCSYHRQDQAVKYCSAHIGLRPWLNVSAWLAVRVDDNGEVRSSRLFS